MTTKNTRILNSSEVIKAIGESLGVDYNFITRMDITLIPGKPVEIDVERLGTSDMMGINWDKLGKTNE